MEMDREYIHYKDLVTTYEGKGIIPYEELLNTVEWREKREKILKRDDYYCQKCGKSETMWHNGFITFNLYKRTFYKQDGERIAVEHPEKSDRPIYLHVHHTFYILGKLPWDYDDNTLQTLCNWCHWVFHEKEKVPVYAQTANELKEMNYTPCKRCNGAGIFPEYKHVQAGLCFRCRGTRYEELIPNLGGE